MERIYNIYCLVKLMADYEPPCELTDEEYSRLYAQESRKRRVQGLKGAPYVRRKPFLCHPQDSNYKRWLEDNL